MRFRSIFTLPVTLLAIFLHLSCCLFPLISIAAISGPYLDVLSSYKSVFIGIQYVVIFYLIIRLVLDKFRLKRFCGIGERVMHFASLAIAFAGLVLSTFEPFKTENQRLAEQRFELFKNHRQLHINLTDRCNYEKLRSDLADIKGVKSNRIKIADNRLLLTFQSNRISRKEIVRILRDKGHEVQDL